MKLKDIVIYIAFLLMLGIAITMSFLRPTFFNHYEETITSNTNDVIDEFIKNHQDTLVEKKIFNNNLLEVVTKDNRYNVTWFNTNGEYLDINSIINNLDSFNNKVNELLYLKYPQFIGDSLISNSNKVYYFKDNELVIYYYDYYIEPNIDEELFLRVNYNEIKDYLNINVDVDSNYNNEMGFVIDNTKKHIALTFDDGPGKYTSTLVNYLNAGFAHATFFMQGSRVSSYKGAVKDVANSGSEIAYHSYQHKYFKNQSASEIKKDLEKSNEALKKITGSTFEIVRPPYGNITDDSKKVLDMPIILWNVDTEDWKNKDSEYLVNYVLENIKDGDIVLFHDIHETSVEAIPNLLKELYVRGYQSVTVTELANIKNKELVSGEIYRSIK